MCIRNIDADVCKLLILENRTSFTRGRADGADPVR